MQRNVVYFVLWGSLMGSDLRGMMLYCYSQDIEIFSVQPQRSKPYPSENDHQWQRTIMEIFGQPTTTETGTAN